MALSLTSAEHNIVVAYSGGLDSHALLRACQRLKLPLRAIHIHHGLQSQADAWVIHCEKICHSLGVPLDVIYINAKAASGQSPEEAARIARYQALENALQPGDYLFTAQHMDDQSETVLLQLLRGAGPAGLAAMPQVRRLGNILHGRPLLSFTRAEIETYARQEKLQWVEDPSNKNTHFDRNFIRQTVIPGLQQRWSSLNTSLSTVATLQQETLELVETLAAIDLSTVITQQHNVLLISRLNLLSAARQKNVLRYWLRKNAVHKLRRSLLEEIQLSVLGASVDATPLIQWGDYEIRRYQNKLYLLQRVVALDRTKTFLWRPVSPLTINTVGVRLTSHQSNVSPGLKPELREKTLQLRFRQGGERIRPAGKDHHIRLKSLLQNANIPPWQRDRIVLIYDDKNLLAVAGYWLAEEHLAEPGQAGWRIEVEEKCINDD